MITRFLRCTNIVFQAQKRSKSVKSFSFLRPRIKPTYNVHRFQTHVAPSGPRFGGAFGRVAIAAGNFIRRFLRPPTAVQRPLLRFMRPRRLQPVATKFMVDPAQFRLTNPLAAISYMIFEREKETISLIERIKSLLSKEYPKSLEFHLPSDKGRRLRDFTLGNFIAKGSYGAVFNAKLKSNFETDSDFNCSKEFDQKCNLVIKQMFNYNAESNNSIFREFDDEIIFNKDDYYKRFLTHPFVMPSERAFIDYFANHPSTEAEFPATKPDDAGREKTMYIVLEKVDTNLDNFLKTEGAGNLSIKERLLLCAQLFEAVSHLEKMKMTHRDIKPDNIFLKKENGLHRLYLADFGCSIDKVIFKNEPGEQRRGNMAFMPPEILNIKRNDVLDYSSADRWSITLIALDILFGHLARGNPFYPLRGGRRVFCNQKDYEDDDLAYFFSRHTPPSVQKDCPKRILDLFQGTLSKDPSERPKTRDVLNTLYLFALPNAPKLTCNSFENFERFDSWLIQLYVKVQGAKTTAEEIIKCFLQNLEYEDVRGVINKNSITTKY